MDTTFSHIKAVFCDIDGTLLTSQHTVSPRAVAAIRALREEGAEVTQVMSNTNYAIPETMRLFEEQSIQTYDVIGFDRVVKKACEMGVINDEQAALVMEWLNTPWTWAAMHGVVAIAREN